MKINFIVIEILNLDNYYNELKNFKLLNQMYIY